MRKYERNSTCETGLDEYDAIGFSRYGVFTAFQGESGWLSWRVRKSRVEGSFGEPWQSEFARASEFTRKSRRTTRIAFKFTLAFVIHSRAGGNSVNDGHSGNWQVY